MGKEWTEAGAQRPDGSWDLMVTLESGRRVLQPGQVREWALRCRCGEVRIERQMFTDAVKWWAECEACGIKEHLLVEDERYLDPEDAALALAHLEAAAEAR